MYSVQLITHLNNLILICKDSAVGFVLCADSAENPMLKAALTQHHLHCSNCASELEALLASLGGSTQLSSTLPASRRWLEVKTNTLGKHEDAVLQEYNRCQQMTIDAYQDVLSQHLPQYVQIIVSRQLTGLQERNREVKSLLDNLYANA